MYTEMLWRQCEAGSDPHLFRLQDEPREEGGFRLY